MTEMSSVTKNSALATKQTAASISSLALLVDNLNAAASRFKLPAPVAETTIVQPRLVASR